MWTVTKSQARTATLAGRSVRLPAAWVVTDEMGNVRGLRHETREAAEAALAATTDRPVATPARDHSADRVASMVGLASSTPTGQCHYCGLTLDRNGYCDECF
jgi:hypothetical protein